MWASQLALVFKKKKNPPANVKDAGSIPGSRHGGRHGNPLQYSCLEDPLNRGAWQTAVHRVVKSQDMTEAT